MFGSIKMQLKYFSNQCFEQKISKHLVHSRSACRRPIQGDPPGYWLLERAQPWVESEAGRFGCKLD